MKQNQRNYYFNQQQKPQTLQKVCTPSYVNQRSVMKKSSTKMEQHQDKVDILIGRMSVKQEEDSQSDKELKAIKIIIFHLKAYAQKKKYQRIIEKMHKYQQFIIKELIDTEVGYVEDLVRMITISNYIQQWLSKQQNDQIFINVKSIYKLHQKLLDDLQKLAQQKNNFKEFGRTFCEYAPFFKIYYEYYSQYKKSQQVLEQSLKQYSEFNEYNKSLIYAKEFNCQQIDSYLIKPVQRLPKYVLLISDLVKHTLKGVDDYNYLIKCQKIIESVNQGNNELLDKVMKNSRVFDLQRLFGDELEVVDSKRMYITEQTMTMLHKSKEKTITLFILSDLLIAAENQQTREKPYHLIFGIHLDHSSSCFRIQSLESYQNAFTVQGSDVSITFIEESDELIQERINQFQLIIDSLITKKKQRDSQLQSMKIEVKDDHLVSVQVIGVEERKTGLTSHKVYVVQIEIGNVCQKIFLRFSQCVQLQDQLKKKYPDSQLNYIKQHNALSMLGSSEAKEIEGRKIQINNFLSALLSKRFMRQETQVLKSLGLPENFYDLPNLVTDEDKHEQTRNPSLRSSNRFQYVSPATQFQRKNGSVQHEGYNDPRGKKYSATQLVCDQEQKKRETMKNIGGKSSKDGFQILVNHLNPRYKTQLVTISYETKSAEVLDMIKEKFQLQDVVDFRLFILDNKQRYKPLEGDERISDHFGSSFIIDLYKRKEVYFRKYLYFDLLSEKEQLGKNDPKKLEFVYYQFLSDVKDAQLMFKLDQYFQLAAAFNFVNDKKVTYDQLEKVIPSRVLKLENKETWITKVNYALKIMKQPESTSQFSSIASDSTQIQSQIKATTNKESIPVNEPRAQFQDRRTMINTISTDSTQIQSQIKTTTNKESIPANDFRAQLQDRSTMINTISPDVQLTSDQILGMLTFIQICWYNEFCGKQIFQVQSKELVKDYGDSNFNLVIGFEGVVLYNQKKTLLKKFNEITDLRVFPSTLQFKDEDQVYRLETNQGFQIQSLLEEYSALRDL